MDVAKGRKAIYAWGMNSDPKMRAQSTPTLQEWLAAQPLRPALLGAVRDYVPEDRKTALPKGKGNLVSVVEVDADANARWMAMQAFLLDGEAASPKGKESRSSANLALSLTNI